MHNKMHAFAGGRP